jgi:hypothetical protein
MARYPLISYRYQIPLGTGTVVTRIDCPSCGAVHTDIREAEQRGCGCGCILTVYGLELAVEGGSHGTEYGVPDAWRDT